MYCTSKNTCNHELRVEFKSIFFNYSWKSNSKHSLVEKNFVDWSDLNERCSFLNLNFSFYAIIIFVIKITC